MAEKVLMLALSPTMEKGHIAEWLKKEGDSVASGDVLCEVETDKATMDYESAASGVLLKIVAEAGSEAAVGELIAIIGEEGEDVSALLAEGEKKSPVVAEVGEEEPAPDAEEANKPASGDTSTEKEKAEEQAIDTAERASDAKTPEQNDSPASKATSASKAEDGFIKASPLARKLALQKELRLADISGSGPRGRVIKADIDRAEQAQVEGTGVEVNKVAGAKEASVSAVMDRVIPLSPMRKTIAERLSVSKYSAPHYYLRISLEADALLTAHKKLNDRREQSVSLNAFLTKFVAEALKKHPKMNATWEGDGIRQFGSIDLGTAVALKDGLITPVVRNCGAKGIIAIDEELKVLIEKARASKLTPEEYQGATFTLSNLGSFGIDEFSAIINPPGSAILAIGAIKKELVVLEDESTAVRSILRLTLSCDHRVIDGAVAAAFLANLKEMIESPISALF